MSPPPSVRAQAGRGLWDRALSGRVRRDDGINHQSVGGEKMTDGAAWAVQACLGSNEYNGIHARCYHSKIRGGGKGSSYVNVLHGRTSVEKRTKRKLAAA
ncbi:hypothetical protein Naga_100916g1 [Nannochloropsis gaditana]|uniref:Uncharacterized protein n=1 Tax=Nannochloropsis gaditana TaxID=72520 RepID=W7T6S3_9STRA|nr:hypothetical protein Naga_100916g1 [Nannochloropsis gaditana]